MHLKDTASTHSLETGQKNSDMLGSKNTFEGHTKDNECSTTKSKIDMENTVTLISEMLRKYTPAIGVYAGIKCNSVKSGELPVINKLPIASLVMCPTCDTANDKK